MSRIFVGYFNPVTHYGTGIAGVNHPILDLLNEPKVLSGQSTGLTCVHSENDFKGGFYIWGDLGCQTPVLIIELGGAPLASFGKVLYSFNIRGKRNDSQDFFEEVITRQVDCEKDTPLYQDANYAYFSVAGWPLHTDCEGHWDDNYYYNQTISVQVQYHETKPHATHFRARFAYGEEAQPLGATFEKGTLSAIQEGNTSSSSEITIPPMGPFRVDIIGYAVVNGVEVVAPFSSGAYEWAAQVQIGQNPGRCQGTFLSDGLRTTIKLWVSNGQTFGNWDIWPPSIDNTPSAGGRAFTLLLGQVPPVDDDPVPPEDEGKIQPEDPLPVDPGTNEDPFPTDKPVVPPPNSVDCKCSPWYVAIAESIQAAGEDNRRGLLAIKDKLSEISETLKKIDDNFEDFLESVQAGDFQSPVFVDYTESVEGSDDYDRQFETFEG